MSNDDLKQEDEFSSSKEQASGADSDPTDAVLEERDLRNENDSELGKITAERDEYLDLLQRVKSDYTNFQRRAQKERDTERLYACLPLATNLLDVLDNLERAITAAAQSEESENSSVLDGVKMVHQQMVDTLTRHGLKAIEAVGLVFDPNIHEALMQQESSEHEPGTVMNELQKGYMLHERVVRPSKVMIAKAPATEE